MMSKKISMLVLICLIFVFGTIISVSADECNGIIEVNSNIYAPLEVIVSAAGRLGVVLGSNEFQATLNGGTAKFKLDSNGKSVDISAKSPTNRVETYKNKQTLPYKCSYTISLGSRYPDIIIE